MDELRFGAAILGVINVLVEQTPHQHFQGHLQLWGSLITCQLFMVSMLGQDFIPGLWQAEGRENESCCFQNGFY